MGSCITCVNASSVRHLQGLAQLESGNCCVVLAGIVNDWRVSMELLTATLAVSVVLYLAGGFLKGKDYRPEAERGLSSAQRKVLSDGVCLVTFAGS